MEHLLEFDGVSKDYAGFALQDISFQLPRGYIMGMIGANGAGKTTTLKLIMQLIRATHGRVVLFGDDTPEGRSANRGRIGFVQDDPMFYGHLSLTNMTRIIAAFYPRWNQETFLDLATTFGLSLNKKVRELSRGMLTKFAVCLALSHQAELIIMDEPTTGLDPVARRQLLTMLSDYIANAGKSVLFSTHITSDLERIADYVTFLQNGRLVFCQAKDDILDNWRIVKGDNRQLDDQTEELFVGWRRTDYGFTALAPSAANAHGHFGDTVLIERATLEDIMFFTGRQDDHLAEAGEV